jgi:hypothetical protein
MLDLVQDVAWGLLATTLMIIGVAFRYTGKTTPPPFAGESKLAASRRLWSRYVANLRVAFAHPALWGLMGAATAFWIVASTQGWVTVK